MFTLKEILPQIINYSRGSFYTQGSQPQMALEEQKKLAEQTKFKMQEIAPQIIQSVRNTAQFLQEPVTRTVTPLLKKAGVNPTLAGAIGFVGDVLATPGGAEKKLLNEAKKFKSAEEFVKAQDTKNILYRGERSGKGMGKGASVMGKGLYLSPTEETAMYYADNVASNVKRYEVIGEPKLLEKNSVEFGKIHDKSFDKAKRTDWDYERVIGEDVQKAGYDGVIDTEGKKVVIFKPDKFLKEAPTKSQLTDIWNKATKFQAIKPNNPNL